MTFIKSLLGRLKPRTSAKASKKIFILGSGRSGTHWIGYILQAHPDIRATVEAEPAWGWVKRMAVDPGSRQELYPKLMRYYQQQHNLSAPLHYLDKSHPNIWLAEQLAASFEDALFLGIIRNPYATVASMLRHEGVQGWHDRWKEFPVPNRFLGIAESDEANYEDLPVAVKCAMRWRSHRDQMEHLKSQLGERIMVVQYEKLVNNTAVLLDEIGEFVGLTSPIPSPQTKASSLDKWKGQLSGSEIRYIQGVVGIAPASANDIYDDDRS